MGKKLCLMLTLCLLSVGMSFAQKTVTGSVIDNETGEPIYGATVKVDGTSIGTTTNIDGEFTLQNVPNTARTLKVTYVGMKDMQLDIKPKMRIHMDARETQTDEVIVVAFGTAKKSAFTGSAKVVKSDEIEKKQVTNVLDALNGKSAGIQLFNASGAPGATSPSMYIRGISSVSSGNAPLIIVDGAPFAGDLNTINSSDIESMTVLKDAASNALYGSRGANGVIVITTKRGDYERPVITVDSKWGGNSRATRRYKTINNPALYYETYYKTLKNYATSRGMDESSANAYARQNLIDGGNGLHYNVYSVPEGQYLIGENGKLNPNAKMGNLYNGNLLQADDWLDEAYGTGLRQEYNMTASVSNATTNFFASAGYLNQEGIVKGTGFERFTSRLKAEVQLKPWLKIGGNFSFTHYEGKGVDDEGSDASSGNIFAVATRVAPIYPLYIRDAQGKIMYDEAGNKRYDYGEGDNGGLTRPTFGQSNALGAVYLDENSYEGNAFNATGFADIILPYGFKFSSINTALVDETRGTGFTNPYYGQYKSQNGVISKSHSRTYRYNFQQLLNWHQEYGLHDVEVMLGHETYRANSASLSAYKNNMFDPTVHELAAAITDGSPSSSTSRYNTEGWFGRALYNYDQKYYGSFSLRRDGSSRFHKDNRWGNFWSAGGAWIISREEWFPKNIGFDMLKLKASYGQQGNDNISNFLYTNTYSIVTAMNHPAAVAAGYGNKEISWEKGSNFNAGFEFEALKHRLNGSFEYFYRKTSDMLFYFSLPSSFGYGGYYDNVGDMRNSGIELEINYDIFRSKDFTWNVTFNITHYRNKITKLDEQNKTLELDGYKGFQNGNKFIGEDLPLFTYRLHKYAGVNENGESLWYVNAPLKNAETGEIIRDDEGNIQYGYMNETTKNPSESSWYKCGTALPDVYGGFGTSLKWKGFDFSIDFAYQLGGKVYDSEYASLMGSPTSSSRGSAMHADILKAWTPENTSSNIPRHQFGDTYTNSASDRFLTSASYLSLQNINFGYTLPKSLTRKIYVENLRVYVAADNVFLWSKRQGLDPRMSISGATSTAYYAPIRSISGGLTVTF